jgi:hypothetical protein
MNFYRKALMKSKYNLETVLRAETKFTVSCGADGIQREENEHAFPACFYS